MAEAPERASRAGPSDGRRGSAAPGSSGAGGGPRRGREPPSREGAPEGIRLITTYKLVKAVVQAVLAAALIVLRGTGVTDRISAAVAMLAHEVSHQWTAALAHRLAHLLDSADRIYLVSGALGVDAVLSAIEGLALRRRLWWSPWLVVVATGTLIPFEIAELFRHPRPGRFLLLAVNVAIVAYLLRRARRERVS